MHHMKVTEILSKTTRSRGLWREESEGSNIVQDPNLCSTNMSQDRQSSSQPQPPQDCFRKVKISRVLEPLLPSDGGVGVGFGEGEGEGEGVDDGEGEQGRGVEVPP